MSQPSVTAYFNTRKRQATDDLRNKAKVLLLDREESRVVSSQSPTNEDNLESSGTLTPIQEEKTVGVSPKSIVVPGKELATDHTLKPNTAVRNIQFDSPKSSAQKMPKPNVRARVTRTRKLSGEEGQVDIRESFQKITEDLDIKKVLFEKKGALSPRKKLPGTPKKDNDSGESSLTNCTTPKKCSTMDKLAKQELSLNDIKSKINKSSKFSELKTSLARLKNHEQRLEQLYKNDKKPQIQKFEKIQLEIPVR